MFTFDKVVKEKELSSKNIKQYHEEVREMCSYLFKSTLSETEQTQVNGVSILSLGLNDKDLLLWSEHGLLPLVIKELFSLG